MWKYLFGIYVTRQRLKRAARGIDPYVSPERYFEYSRVVQSLQRFPAGASILDVGSNDSLMPTILAGRGYLVTCVDPYDLVRRQREFAHAMGNGYRIKVALALGEKLPFRDRSFDAATCISTLEHLAGTGDTATLGEVCRVLKPDGYIYMSFPWQKFYYEYWGKEPLYANDDSSELKLIARTYDLASLEERLLRPTGLRLTRGIRGEAPSGISWTEQLLRRSPLPGLADLYRGAKYATHPLGGELLHRRFTAVVFCQKPVEGRIAE